MVGLIVGRNIEALHRANKPTFKQPKNKRQEQINKTQNRKIIKDKVGHLKL